MPPGGNGFYAWREWAWAGVFRKSRGLREEVEVYHPERGRESVSQKGGVRLGTLGPACTCQRGQAGLGRLFIYLWQEEGRKARP